MEIRDTPPVGDRLTAGEIDKIVRRRFDARGERVSMEFVNSAVEGTGLKLTLRLVVWDVDEQGNKSIRDIKEQEVYFGDAPLRHERERFETFLEGWGRALKKCFETAEVDTLMPHDLCYAGTRSMVTLVTAGDFEAAHLVKSRLGRWMKT